MDQSYPFGLLALTHLLIGADGTIDNLETNALKIIRQRENISDEFFREFTAHIAGRNERDIFQDGMEALNRCSHEEKLKVFVILYKLSEVDGRVHVKEIRLLLYSIKKAGIDFQDVVNKALVTPSLL